MQKPNKILLLGAALFSGLIQSYCLQPAYGQFPQRGTPTTPLETRPATSSKSAPESGAFELTDEPYQIPSLGMSIFLPSGALVDLSRLQGGRTTVEVRPEGAVPEWVLQVQSSISADHDLTLGDAMANIIEQRQQVRLGRDAQGREFSLVRIFDRDEDLVVGEHPAQRVYLDVPTDPESPVTGYTVFHTGPGQFVIVQMDCKTALFPRFRQLYETIVATVSFRDSSELNSDRGAALLAGESLLKTFDNTSIEAVLNEDPVFYRISKPAASGAPEDAEEIGYQRIIMRKGFAGELSRRREREQWNEGDRQAGYVVRSDARALMGGAVVETVSMFFLSEDRDTELWSVRMTVQNGDKPEEWTEVGIRRKDVLTVKTAGDGEEDRRGEWSPLPAAYISRVESYLLPKLVQKLGAPGQFGFYMYESSLGKLTLRRETFEVDPAGRWRVSTLPTENASPSLTLLDHDGAIIRRLMPDGQVMEPETQQRLSEIWRRKGLPLK